MIKKLSLILSTFLISLFLFSSIVLADDSATDPGYSIPQGSSVTYGTDYNLSTNGTGLTVNILKNITLTKQWVINGKSLTNEVLGNLSIPANQGFANKAVNAINFSGNTVTTYNASNSPGLVILSNCTINASNGGTIQGNGYADENRGAFIIQVNGVTSGGSSTVIGETNPINVNINGLTIQQFSPSIYSTSKFNTASSLNIYGYSNVDLNNCNIYQGTMAVFSSGEQPNPKNINFPKIQAKNTQFYGKQKSNTDGLGAFNTNGSDNGQPYLNFTDCLFNANYSSDKGYAAAVYLPNKNVTEAIFTDCNIVGSSGIAIKGGSLTISGGTITANGEKTPVEPSDNGCDADGSAITVGAAKNSSTVSSNSGYGKVKIIIKDNPVITSENASAFSLQPASTNADGTNSGFNTLADNDPITIESGTFNSAPDEPSLNFGSNTAAQNSLKDSVQGGAYSDPSGIGTYLDESITEAGIVDTTIGEFTVYGPNTNSITQQITLLDQAVKEITENPSAGIIGEPTTIPVIPGSDDTNLNPPPNSGNKNGIFSLSLGDSFPTYIRGTNNPDPINQSNNIGLQIATAGSPVLVANALNWSITPLNNAGSNNTINFNTSPWSWQVENGQYYLETSSNGWTISQQVNLQTKNGSLVLVENTNTPIVVSGGPAYLKYNGQGNLPEGIYQLNAVAQTGTYSGNTAPQDSMRFMLNVSEITGVSITQDGKTAPAYQNVNMQTTPTIQFGYNTTPASAYPGSNVNWTVTTGANGSASQYASINPTTGLLRLKAPTPPGTILYVSVTVDGVPSTPIAIAVTGEAVSTDITEIAPYYEEVNVLNNSTYNLAQNVFAMPGYQSLADAIANAGGKLTFSSDNTNVLIYGSSILPVNTNFTGPVEVTATYTNKDNTTATTTFTVNFVSKEVLPTGVTALSELNMVVTDTTPQNVMAKLTPENSTTQAYPGSFTYTSSNPNVASVDPTTGEVYANNVGTATITSTLSNTSGISLTPPSGQTAVTSATTTVTVTETPSDVPATSITANPTDVYLAPSTEAEADHSKTITVTTEPENTTDEVTYTISPQSVATVTDNGDGTYTVTAGDEGRATITFTAGDVSATVDVLVSDEPVIAESITASGTTPDTFTVNVNNVGPNPAIHATGANISHVSIFTWSGPDQVDRQCKAVPNDDTGNYSYTPFEVNGNLPNTWYFNADNIYVQCYANVDGEEVYLGAVTPNYKWVNAATAGDHHVAYITYQENRGFNVPTVFDGAESGVTGQHLQLEGLRVSSNIEGVDVVTEVHAQNIGWSATRS